MIEFEVAKESKPIACIKVIGVGGAGGNTINSIIESGYQGFECIAVNTDAQALELSKAQHKIQIGMKSTKGLGTGTNPEVGKRAAEEDLDRILNEVEDADIVFLAGGMGGGTGSGAMPVLARALKERGVLTIVIVTRPFLFEGRRRTDVANEAIDLLSKDGDIIIIIPNQKLLDFADQNVSMIDAFNMINDVLGQSVRGISDIITKPGHINVDFADVRTIMKGRGLAVMGTARASGESRAEQAAMAAISSPLLENVSVKGAQAVLLNITGGKNLGLHEIRQAATIVYEQAHQNANIILGSVIDDSLEDELIVTIIATGFHIENEPTKDLLIEKEEQVAQKLEPTSLATKDDQGEKNKEPKQNENELQAKEIKREYAVMDMSDIDIPTFLRKKNKDESTHQE